MSLLYVASKFKEYMEAKCGKVSENYKIQQLIDEIRLFKEFINEMNIKYHTIKDAIENGIDSKEFAGYIETKVDNIEYSFLPSGYDREDLICLCDIVARNWYKIKGTVVYPKGKYDKNTMRWRAYNDALNKLKTCEYYHIKTEMYNLEIETTRYVDYINSNEKKIIKEILKYDKERELDNIDLNF